MTRTDQYDIARTAEPMRPRHGRRFRQDTRSEGLTVRRNGGSVKAYRAKSLSGDYDNTIAVTADAVDVS